jgi:hypothetical protein
LERQRWTNARRIAGGQLDAKFVDGDVDGEAAVAL